MKDTLKKLAALQGDACVTIIAQTHRTKPDNLQDPILLKNLIKEAEQRLLAEYDRATAEDRIARLHKLAGSVNHDQNLDALILLVGNNNDECYQLPVMVANRVVVDRTFATRDLVRAMQEQSEYYVLVLSRQQARLISAHSDQVKEELGKPFPMENSDLYTTDRLKQSMANTTDQYIEEFFNRVDKAVQEIWKTNPAPVIVATEQRNYDHYLKIADRPIVAAHLGMNRDDEKAHHIVSAAWPIMQQYNRDKNAQRISELKQAVGRQQYVSDLSDIWRAVNEGRGATLFVKRGYYQPARIDNGAVVPVDAPNGHSVVDDIVDEMIELNLKHGGDTVFLEGTELDAFQGVALTTRY